MPRQIRVTKARTFVIDPKKKYVMILPAGEITEKDAHYINKEFARWGTDCLAILTIDPLAIKIIEAEGKDGS